jgi:hypothetical protein
MTSRQLTYTFIAKNEFSGVADSIANKVNSLKGKFAQFNRELKQSGVTFDSVAGKMQSWAGKMKWVSAGVIAAGTASLIAASNYEKLGIQFEILTGSASKGQALLKELRQFSLEAGPFESEEIMASAKAMLNFKFASEDVVKNLKMMATLAAGSEIPLQTITDALGRAQSTGRVNPRSVISLRKLGVEPLLQARLNLTHEEYKKKLAAGLIPAAALFEVLNDKARTYGDLLARIDNTTGEVMGDTKTLLVQIAAEWGAVLDKSVGARQAIKGFNDVLVSVRDGLLGC